MNVFAHVFTHFGVSHLLREVYVLGTKKREYAAPDHKKLNN